MPVFCAHKVQQHLLVPLQFLDKGAFMEQCLQPLLGVVVAELLKRGPPLLLGQSGVLKTGSVHDQQGAQRVLTGLQSSKEQKINLKALEIRILSTAFQHPILSSKIIFFCSDHVICEWPGLSQLTTLHYYKQHVEEVLLYLIFN